MEEHGGSNASYLNLAVTDGNSAAACRFTNAGDRKPESLYVIEREIYRPVAKDSPGRRRTERSTSFVVSSERLTDDPAWQVVEPNHLISIARDGTARLFRMSAEGLLAA